MNKVLWCLEVAVEVGPDEANFLAVKKVPCLKPVVEGTEFCPSHQKALIWP